MRPIRVDIEDNDNPRVDGIFVDDGAPMVCCAFSAGLIIEWASWINYWFFLMDRFLGGVDSRGMNAVVFFSLM